MTNYLKKFWGVGYLMTNYFDIFFLGGGMVLDDKLL